ncbi:MAG: helix-turn-helix domain-containing protein [Brasilonema sp.]
MSRPFKVEITETQEELKKRLQTARLGSQKEKLQMLWWLKSGQVKEQQEIGKRLGRDTSTVTRWLQKYRLGGLSSLLEIKNAPGATRKMSDKAIAQGAVPSAIAALKQELETGKGFSGYGAIAQRADAIMRIVEWLEKKYGEKIEYGTVYGWVRYRFGAKLKVSRPRSYKQDEDAVQGFKKNSVLYY